MIDNGFIHSIFTFDPNGISLEFSCSVKNIDIRRAPIIADELPTEVSKEGPNAQPGKWKQAERATLAGERKIYPGELKKFVK